jgi:hypothetical protein
MSKSVSRAVSEEWEQDLILAVSEMDPDEVKVGGGGIRRALADQLAGQIGQLAISD